MDFHYIEDCSQCCIEREYYPSKKFAKIGVLIRPEEKERIKELAIKNELKIKKQLELSGWKVPRNGWPDFLCLNEKTNRVLAVEVKTGNDQLRKEQKSMIEALKLCGIPTNICRNGTGLKKRGRKRLYTFSKYSNGS